MKLMHELNGMIILKKSEFRTIEEATSNSSQHGFLSHKWQIVTDE